MSEIRWVRAAGETYVNVGDLISALLDADENCSDPDLRDFARQLAEMSVDEGYDTEIIVKGVFD